jgi:hypothetical protein
MAVRAELKEKTYANLLVALTIVMEKVEFLSRCGKACRESDRKALMIDRDVYEDQIKVCLMQLSDLGEDREEVVTQAARQLKKNALQILEGYIDVEYQYYGLTASAKKTSSSSSSSSRDGQTSSSGSSSKQRKVRGSRKKRRRSDSSISSAGSTTRKTGLEHKRASPRGAKVGIKPKNVSSTSTSSSTLH